MEHPGKSKNRAGIDPGSPARAQAQPPLAKANSWWPPEWAPQERIWLAWPHRSDLWNGALRQVQYRIARIALLLSRRTTVAFLSSAENCWSQQIQPMLESQAGTVSECRLDAISWNRVATNDIWIRDYGPLCVRRRDGGELWLDFRFNAWGAKYEPWDLDDRATALLAEECAVGRQSFPFVLEGGALETNGSVLLAARDCIFEARRRLDLTESELDQLLRQQLGVAEIIWLPGILPGDDTDGHVDMYIRFANRQQIVMAACDREHPAWPMLREARSHLESRCKEIGQPVQIIDLPLPPVLYQGNRILPRTYANFLISNEQVLVPVYNCSTDESALSIIAQVFNEYTVEAVYAGDLITEGGAIHCLSMPRFL
ncbi:MAG: agmatine deiminase family protein [Leptospiraceae bacterium]|nr:agmatine deiminase family protein [Leptospiraceae bacterium]